MEKLYGRCVRLCLLVTVQISFQMGVHEPAVSPGMFILIHVDDPFQSVVFSSGRPEIFRAVVHKEAVVFLVRCRMFVFRLLADYATGLRAASIFRSIFVAV